MFSVLVSAFFFFFKGAHNQRPECPEKRNPRRRYVHAPWPAKGSLFILLNLRTVIQCLIARGMTEALATRQITECF